MTIAENLTAVRERIAAACERAGRPPEDVTLVGISKGFPADPIAEACAAGLRDVGENRVQEALPKIEALAARGVEPRWHLVGHIQTNKAKLAAERFAILHGVDSVRLAEALNRRAQQHLSVLLEVNVGQEASKFGFDPRELATALTAIAPLNHLDVRGLMTVAPLTDDPERTRPVFRRLRELRDELAGRPEWAGTPGWLSMGMSADFEVAIEEGATHVRIGTALFGPRG